MPCGDGYVCAMQQRARVFSYDVSLDADWTAASGEGGSTLPRETEWSPEHLLLAGLARCSLTSLEYHARRDGLGLRVAAASARGDVTRREADSRFAFVAIDVEADVALEPAPEDVRELLAKAERDCFVGAPVFALSSRR